MKKYLILPFIGLGLIGCKSTSTVVNSNTEVTQKEETVTPTTEQKATEEPQNVNLTPDYGIIKQPVKKPAPSPK